MEKYTLPPSIGFIAGVTVSLIKPFKEGRGKEKVMFDEGDRSSLSKGREFLETAVAYGPYERTQKNFELLPGDIKNYNIARFVFDYITNSSNLDKPIDLNDVKSELCVYISLMKRMEEWQIPKNPKEIEIAQLERLDNFWRYVVSYDRKRTSCQGLLSLVS